MYRLDRAGDLEINVFELLDKAVIAGYLAYDTWVSGAGHGGDKVSARGFNVTCID